MQLLLLRTQAVKLILPEFWHGSVQVVEPSLPPPSAAAPVWRTVTSRRWAACSRQHTHRQRVDNAESHSARSAFKHTCYTTTERGPLPERFIRGQRSRQRLFFILAGCRILRCSWQEVHLLEIADSYSLIEGEICWT